MVLMMFDFAKLQIILQCSCEFLYLCSNLAQVESIFAADKRNILQ